ncbi:hypothetical protein [Aquimarina algiphila]|uniref:hypothetical protein n=1 Tax=Aquimarina algiphila TaxID=2047982 RepID=UPI0024918E49|nr:hypothetical protein [Aquimarina algiphila]
MTAVERYNNLDGNVVSRDALKRLLSKACKEKEHRVVTKIETLLERNDNGKFKITIAKKLSKPVQKVKRKTKRVTKASRKARLKKKAFQLTVKGLGIPVIHLATSQPVTAPKIIEHTREVLPPVQKTFKSQIISQQKKEPVQIKPKRKPIKGLPTMADLDHMEEPTETFRLETELGEFLGDLEKKPEHSVVATLDAPAGSGKTRVFFQAMEGYANDHKKCLFFTLEEHSKSKLFKDKRNQYISPENYSNITIIDDVSNYEEFKKLVEAHDVIFVDSFGKLQRLIKSFKLELDDHIRKAFDGKLFFLIFQRTTGKTMRGGSDSEFDGDVILQVEKPDEDYRNNYLVARKNRYNEIPMLKYSIYHQRLTKDSEEVKKTPTKKAEPLQPKLIVRSL